MKQNHIIKAVQQAITELNGLDAAVLYGSFARGDATPNSDIDLGLLVNDHFPAGGLDQGSEVFTAVTGPYYAGGHARQAGRLVPRHARQT
jgi:DNA polymerase sigma